MDGIIDSLEHKEYISVYVQDPRIHVEDFWHSHIDYEICLHTNSMYFRRKTSCVRRRYSEFVWLRQRLQDNALLIDLPKLPPWNPFFSLRNSCQVAERMKGLQRFLEESENGYDSIDQGKEKGKYSADVTCNDQIRHRTSFVCTTEEDLCHNQSVTYSRLHLFLQSRLSIQKIEACAQGNTRYSVAQAIHGCPWPTPQLPPVEEEENDDIRTGCDSDCESTSSSGFGQSIEPSVSLTEGTSSSGEHS